MNEAILGPGGRSGSGDMLELAFFGLATGVATLTVATADFRDTAHHSISITTQGGTIRVGQPNDVSEAKDRLGSGLTIENYPNPFNPATTIVYHQEKPGPITMKVYSIVGKEVCSLKQGYEDSGVHEYIWDGHDEYGLDAPSGVYIVRAEVAASATMTKVLLLR